MTDLPDTLVSLPARWGISENATVTRTSRGTNNHTFAVAHGDERWALRISQNLSAPQVHSEHRLLACLRVADLTFDVPTPVTAQDGDTLVETAIGPATLCRWIPGVRPDLSRELALERLGRAIGILDAALTKVPFEDAPHDWRRSDPLQVHPAVSDIGDLCLELVAAGVGSEQVRRFGEAGRRTTASWARLARQLPVQVVHGDLAASNTLVDPETSEVTGLLDFEIAGADFAVQDLVAALLQSGALEGDLWQRRSAALARGRATAYPLSGAEIDALPDLLIGRCVGSALWRAGRWRRGQARLGDVIERLRELDATTRWVTTSGQQLLEVIIAANDEARP